MSCSSVTGAAAPNDVPKWLEMMAFKAEAEGDDQSALVLLNTARLLEAAFCKARRANA